MESREMLEERRLMDYLFLMVESIFHEIYEIISVLEQDTRSERITQKEIISNNKKRILVQERELSSKEIKASLNSNNLIRTLMNLKSNLESVNHLSYSDEQILSLLSNLPHIEIEHYLRTLMKHRVSLLANISSIIYVIKALRSCGYGNPEKYNQLFYFIVKCSLSVIKTLIKTLIDH